MAHSLFQCHPNALRNWLLAAGHCTMHKDKRKKEKIDVLKKL
jgi:hypothetical protein